MVNAFIKKIVTDGYDLVDYVPVGIDRINEKAFLQLGEDMPLEVTDQQFSLAYNPLVIGISMDHQLHEVIRQEQRIIKLFFFDPSKGQKISELFLKYHKVPNAWDSSQCLLVLFHASHAENYQLNWFRRNIILWMRYWKNKRAKKYFGTLPFKLHEQYTAQFSFPRKVGLLAIKDGDFYALFPIDLHGVLRDQNIYTWGIRHSNKAVSHLKNSKKMVIADVPYSSYQTIYSLGNFKHSKEETDNRSRILSRTWQYELPDFILGYKEIELLHDEDIGSQCLFWGKIIHAEALKQGTALHHVHLLRFLQLKDIDKKKLQAV